MRLLENPLIKLIGIIVVLYFALFANKENPQSLGNRLSSERIKKNLGDIEGRGKFILSNVKVVQNNPKINGTASEIVVQETVKDINVGVGKIEVSCGSEVEVLVAVNVSPTKNIMLKPSAKFVIGSKENWLLEKHILGMKMAGVREIIIPQNFKADDPELKRLLLENNADLTYQIILKAILAQPTSTSKFNCQ